MTSRRSTCVPLLLGLAVCGSACAETFTFEHVRVLGTSMDLSVDAADAAAARKFEQTILAEVDRLARIISTHDKTSEVSQLKLHEPAKVSPELIELLGLYDQWEQRSAGALSGRLGEVISLWQDAGKTGALPDPAKLSAAVQRAKSPAWRIDRSAKTVERLTDVPLNLDALGKAFIVDKAMKFALAQHPGISRAMLDIGGEIRCAGDWETSVADPRNPADNAQPVARLRLRNQSIATSGGYARFVTIAGKRYSHVLDARTGQPVDGVLSASVVAPDCATANALATTLCILPSKDALQLTRTVTGAEALLILPEGKQAQTPGWTALASAVPTTQKTTGNPNWPAGAMAQLSLQLPEVVTGKRYRRPYVAVWVEDSQQRVVRTLAVWGNEAKYLKDLSQWRKAAGQNPPKGVSRATRGPGSYTLQWDGRDDRGAFVAAGKYTLRIEAIREKGGHETLSAPLNCSAWDDTVTVQGKQELGAIRARFGAPLK